MTRKPLYPQGIARLSLTVPANVREGLEEVAGRQRQSVSQLASIIFEDWLMRRGELREIESEPAAV